MQNTKTTIIIPYSRMLVLLIMMTALATTMSSCAASDLEPSPTIENTTTEHDNITSRCRTQMMQYGNVAVSHCIDIDMAAYEALQTYSDEHSPFIKRCRRQQTM